MRCGYVAALVSKQTPQYFADFSALKLVNYQSFLKLNNIMFKIKQLFALFLLLNFNMLFAQKGKPLFPQTPGMVSYTYRNSFAKDMVATLDTLKGLGITDIEFSNLFGKKATEIR